MLKPAILCLLQPGVSKSEVPDCHRSAMLSPHHDASKGLQLYEDVAPGQLPDDAVGRSLVHLSADRQATGEAIYCDDMPSLQGNMDLI